MTTLPHLMSLLMSRSWNFEYRGSRVSVIWVKGQLIFESKLFKLWILPKNERKNSTFSTMIAQVDLFSFVFLKNLKTPKGHLEINWTLKENSNFQTHIVITQTWISKGVNTQALPTYCVDERHLVVFFPKSRSFGRKNSNFTFLPFSV